MSVVSARVHHARMARTVWTFRSQLFQRKGIHIRPEGQIVLLFSIQKRDDIGIEKWFRQIQIQRSKSLPNLRGGLPFLSCNFRDLMQSMTKLHNFRQNL